MLTPRQRWLFLTPFVLLVGLFMLWPALFGLASSFTNYDPLHRNALHFVGLQNYQRVTSDSEFAIASQNALVFAVASVSLELTLGLAVAYLLRRPFRGRAIVRVLLLLPWLVSPVASGVMWHFLFNLQNGLLNFWPALLGLPELPDLRGSGLAMPSLIAIEVWRVTPLVGFLLLPGILAIPREHWDLAALEGMSLLTRLRHIVLPRLRLLLLTVGLLLFGGALGTFENILMFSGGGPGSQTATLGLYSYRQAFIAYNWVFGAASAWLIAALVVGLGFGYLALSRRERPER